MASFNSHTFEKMSQNYDSLLISGLQSDVVLVAGEKEFPAHKLVLTTRSPVFAALFTNESLTKETQENRVEFDDINAEILELIVRFIYTGKVDMLDLYAEDLLVAADKYQLNILKSICERKLLSKEITTQSVCDLLILADMHEANELLSKCFDFINLMYLKVCDGYDNKKENIIAMQKNTIPFKLASFDLLIFEEMCQNYDSLLKSELLSDVALVFGEKELRVHKVVLSACSPVFAAMFAHDSTKEAQENRVEIVDVDVDVMKLLIKYIYTGKVTNLDQCAEDLLIVADKYQLNCIKSICERQLISTITAETVADFIIFSDMYQATELNAKCLEYFTNICAGTRVKHSAGWNKLLLRADLLAHLFKHMSLMYSKLINENKMKVESNKKEDLNTAPLLIVADKYQLPSLKSICEQQLLSQITTESSSNLLILADKHGASDLYNKCLDYITENGTQVLASDGWKKLVAKADLLAKLFENLHSKYCRMQLRVMRKIAENMVIPETFSQRKYIATSRRLQF